MDTRVCGHPFSIFSQVFMSGLHLVQHSILHYYFIYLYNEESCNMEKTGDGGKSFTFLQYILESCLQGIVFIYWRQQCYLLCILYITQNVLKIYTKYIIRIDNFYSGSIIMQIWNFILCNPMN